MKRSGISGIDQTARYAMRDAKLEVLAKVRLALEKMLSSYPKWSKEHVDTFYNTYRRAKRKNGNPELAVVEARTCMRMVPSNYSRNDIEEMNNKFMAMLAKADEDARLTTSERKAKKKKEREDVIASRKAAKGRGTTDKGHIPRGTGTTSKAKKGR